MKNGGDKIEVLNVPFEVEPMGDEKSAMESAERQEMIYGAGKYGFYLLIIVAIFFLLVRPILGMMKTRTDKTSLNQIKDMYVKNAVAAGAEMPAPLENKAQAALTDAMKDKALVGAIIKEWVKEGA